MEQKENLKIGLLGLIAVTLIINTYTQFKGNNTAVASSATAANNPAVMPITPPTQPEMQPTPEVPTGPTTTIKFAEEVFDFKNVKQDSENHHKFKFTNTGTEPLIITNAKGSCGCTVPSYPKDPIAPGKTGEIEVTYSPGKQIGNQSKTVTITANTSPSTTQIKISANVEEI